MNEGEHAGTATNGGVPLDIALVALLLACVVTVVSTSSPSMRGR